MDSCTCKDCEKTFSNISNLKKHIRKFHKARIDELAPRKMFVDLKFKCDICKKNFSHQKHLNYHKKTHGMTTHSCKTNKNSKKCPMCDYRTANTEEILQHFQQHDVNLQFEEFNISNLEAFEKWKDSVEKNTNSRYLKISKSDKRIKFICHRSGHYIPEGKKIRCLKTQGSNKIGGYCPASLTVVIDLDGKIGVKFLKTHVGHETDIRHLNLSPAERELIAQKIASKIPFSVILDEMLDSVETCKLQRKHLLNKKDLYNIKNAYNLNSTSVRHKDDAISIENEQSAVSESILEEINKEGNSENLELRKEKFLNQFLNLFNSITSVQQFEVFEKNCAPIAPTLAAMEKAQLP